MADSSTQPSHPRRSEPISKPAGLHLKKRPRLSHVRGPPPPAGFHPTAIGEFEFYVSFCRPDLSATADEVRTQQISTLRRMRDKFEQRMRQAQLITNL